MLNVLKARLRTRSGRVVVAAVAVLLAGAFYWFAPWKLLVNSTVDEALPVATASAPAAAGTFRSYEHPTTGTAELVTLTDGSRLVRLNDLRTSDGPDVRIYLSEKPADAGLHAFGDGSVELGRLKANHGNQNYAVPTGLDLAKYRSVVVWCKRFSVAFGAAPITA
jgi:hypothetical protein